jgi:hypothetical protein
VIVSIKTKAGNVKEVTLSYEQWRELYQSGKWEDLPLAQAQILEPSSKEPNIVFFP